MKPPTDHLHKHKRGSSSATTDRSAPSLATARPALDCNRCGACCCNTNDNRAEAFVDYVQLFPHDTLYTNHRARAEWAIRNDRGEWHLRLTEDHRCVALSGPVGQSVHCTIYSQRPGVCRRVEPGGEECLNARRERGIDLVAQMAPDAPPGGSGP